MFPAALHLLTVAALVVHLVAGCCAHHHHQEARCSHVEAVGGSHHDHAESRIVTVSAPSVPFENSEQDEHSSCDEPNCAYLNDAPLVLANPASDATPFVAVTDALQALSLATHWGRDAAVAFQSPSSSVAACALLQTWQI